MKDSNKLHRSVLNSPENGSDNNAFEIIHEQRDS